MEHLHHFHLNQDPFQNEPDLRFYFESVYQKDVLRRLDRGLRQHKGLCVMTGEGGTGKTVLARGILDALEEEVFEANLMVMLPGASDALSVLKRFARQVGVAEPSSDRPRLLAELYEQLAIVREDGRHCVLILDDAHILCREAMAEVGGLLNLEYEDRRLLSLLFVGLPELDLTLSRESSLAQRVDVRVQLQPLDLNSTTAYLAHRLAVAGGTSEIFTPGAIDSLYKLGRGRPRLLNTLADNALFEAYLARQVQVDSVHVERSAADLGIGLEEGATFPPMPPVPVPPAAPDRGAPGALAESTDLEARPAFELRDAVEAFDEDDDIEFGSLLGNASEAEEEAEGDVTVLSMESPPAAAPAEATRDLDMELGADALPVFDATSAADGEDLALTRIDLGDEAAADQDPDEIDDLFVELLDS